MSFCVNPDQRALQDGVRRFCSQHLDVAALRRLEEVGGVEPRLWRELAELGVFGLQLPLEAGGLGLGVPEAALVFEELGRAAAPGPLVWTHLAAGLIDGADAGAKVIAGVDQLAPPAPLLVEHMAAADGLLVLRPDGVEWIARSALDLTTLDSPLDPLTPVCRLRALPRAERIAGPSEAARLREHGAVLNAAMLVGIADATLELAVSYAKTREQFGRPIGSFQALKHTMADMFARKELARAAVYSAAAHLQTPEVGDAARAVSSARVLSSQAAQRNARACIQVHGGMGYTWDVPAHYYLKRAFVLETVFGDSEEHLTRLAAGI